jgi:hypothetical protein
VVADLDDMTTPDGGAAGDGRCTHCGAAIIGPPAHELVGRVHHRPGPAYRAFCSTEHYEAWLAGPTPT